MDAFISPNDTGGVMKQVDSAAVVDNIFIFTDGTDKFQWTNNRKGVYPLSQAKVLAGDSADKTSILQAVLNHADIIIASPDIVALDYPNFAGLMKKNTVWVEKPRNGSTASKVYKFTTAGYLNPSGVGKTRQAV
jgi:hypothetical protein